MSQYFNLCVKIFIADDASLDRAIQIDPNNLRHWENLTIGVGYQNSIWDGPIKTYTTYEVGDNKTFKYLIEGDSDEVPNTGLFVTYERENFGFVPYTNSMWMVVGQEMEEYEEHAHRLICDTTGPNGESGKIIFTCDDIQQDYHEDYLYEFDPRVSPFHGDDTDRSSSDWSSPKYLCFNSEDSNEEDAAQKQNGADWECWIYIIDQGNPRFSDDIPIKTLQLPSVYKPFYMKVLARINNERTRLTILYPNPKYGHKTTVHSTIFNGIGCFDKSNNIYKVGTFSGKVNWVELTSEITGTTPTLLGNYDSTVHVMKPLEFIPKPWSPSDRIVILNPPVTSLTNISTEFTVTEQEPEGYYNEGIFSVSTLESLNTVSFYKIYFQSGMTSDHGFRMRFTRNSIDGETSQNVRYFLVSYPFVRDYLRSENVRWSDRQDHELNPQLRATVASTRFNSLYGGMYFPNYEAYRESLETPSSTTETGYFKMILIHPEDYMSLQYQDDIVYEFDPYDGEWAVIGITDPLVDLLVRSEDLFLQEKNQGNILLPHTNFVTIMTYKLRDEE